MVKDHLVQRTVIFVNLPTLEELEDGLHFVGVLLEAAEDVVVLQNGLQHLRLNVQPDRTVAVVGRVQYRPVQHLPEDTRHYETMLAQREG